jgi:radical SAM protein with 4Fe4S-binding SPASM domain
MSGIARKLSRRIKKIVLLILKRPKGFADYLKDLLSAAVKSERVAGYPVHITIEPTNYCNLKCPVCETGSGLLQRAKANMQFDDFKKIIDKTYEHINSILFYYMGEPFLNEHAYSMIRYAKGKGIYITTCTNGHFINPHQLLECGVDEVSFQVGDLSNETHQKYRINSDLKEIIGNIEELLRQRELLKRNRPKVILSLIVMKHNESEIDSFLEFAKNLGVDETRLVEPCVRNWEQGRQFLPENENFWLYDRETFKRGILRPKRVPRNRCNWIYFSCVILSDGNVIPCCRDVQGDYLMGNIFKEEFSSIWNGKKYRDFRRAVRLRQKDLKLCALCSDFGIPALY